jgi:threonyl-tRNA synthetase
MVRYDDKSQTLLNAVAMFHMQEEAPGMVFWHEKGWTLYQIVEQYMRSVFKDNDYKEVHTPQNKSCVLPIFR